MDVHPQLNKKEEKQEPKIPPDPKEQQAKQEKQPQVDQMQQVQHVKKKDPVCARCKNPNKNIKKHHFPIGSRRMAFLCNHCYSVVRKQRQRSRRFGQP